MRTDLTAIDAIANVETDVDNQKVFVQIRKDADISKILNQVVTYNDKLKDWELFDD